MQNPLDNTLELLRVDHDKLWPNVVHQREDHDSIAINEVRAIPELQPVSTPEMAQIIPLHPIETPLVNVQRAGTETDVVKQLTQRALAVHDEEAAA